MKRGFLSLKDAFIEDAVAEHLPLARIGTCLSRAWKIGRISLEESAWLILNMFKFDEPLARKHAVPKWVCRRKGLAKSRLQIAPSSPSRLYQLMASLSFVRGMSELMFKSNMPLR
jgi:hypothetical protein